MVPSCAARPVTQRFGRMRGDSTAARRPGIVPIGSIDKTGTRLGYGGGHYDRTLAALSGKPRLIGFAYAAQEFDHIPREARQHLGDRRVEPEAAHPPAARKEASGRGDEGRRRPRHSRYHRRKNGR